MGSEIVPYSKFYILQMALSVYNSKPFCSPKNQTVTPGTAAATGTTALLVASYPPISSQEISPHPIVTVQTLFTFTEETTETNSSFQ